MKPIVVEKCFTINADLDEFWPYFCDQDDINKRSNLSKMHLWEENGSVYGKYHNSIVPMEWKEEPWQWKFKQEYRLKRIYTKGLAYSLEQINKIQAVDSNSCLIKITFIWHPKNFIYSYILSSVTKKILIKFKIALEDIANEISLQKKPQKFNFTDYVPTDPKLINKINEIKKQKVDQNIVNKVISYILTSSPEYLDRIRIKELAIDWDLEYKELIVICLHAVRQGILTLTWDLICPHCKGSRENIPYLSSIQKNMSCEPCGIDFNIMGINSVEVTFHVNPDIRKIEKLVYCSAAPARKPHIIMQISVDSEKERSVNLDLKPGKYRLYERGEKKYNIININKNSEQNKICWQSGTKVFQEELSNKFTLTLSNNLERQNTFIIAKAEDDQLSLLACDVFGIQEFRDMFSKETIASGLHLDIGMQTILFTDVIGSTEFYEKHGDADAFNEVRKHFLVIAKIVSKNDGIILKSLGDAIMASYIKPINAIKSAIELQRYFHPNQNITPIRLRITLNSGTCIAVNLDTKIDYFGRAVNLAAKLQEIANANEIVMSSELSSLPEVIEVLKNTNFPMENLTFSHKSIPKTIDVTKIKVLSSD